MSVLTRHPESKLQGAWNCFQVGLFLFPLLPTWGGLTIIFASFLAWVKKHKIIIRQPVHQALGVLSLLLILTASFAENRTDAWIGLSNFIPYFLVFAGLSILIQTSSQLRRIAWILLLPSIPIVILGLGQYFLGWSGIEQLRGFFGWVIVLNGSPPERMSSVFMYANILAIYLVIVLILGLGLFIERLPIGQAKLETQPETFNPKFKPLIILAIALFGVTIALIFTNSRNAWGLMVFSGVAYAVYLGWWIILALVIAAVAAIFGAAFAPSPLQNGLRVVVPAYFWQRLTDQNFERPVETLRVTQWKFAWNLTQEKPFVGWGLRNFTALYESQMNVWMGHPHNLFLMMTAEVGIPATLLFFGIVGWILAQAVRVYRQQKIPPEDRLIFFSYGLAFTACVLFNLLDVTLYDFRVNTFGWVLLAAIYGNVIQRTILTGNR
ncbi:MAG: O-antigen ligase family protein [Cyanobacteriota bacterium]|nr:O-antigen ligase family protein [Cyanobacteriota bacterium]